MELKFNGKSNKKKKGNEGAPLGVFTARKKKKTTANDELANCYADFVQSFEAKPASKGTTFVHGGSLDPNSNRQVGSKESKRYLPRSSHNSVGSGNSSSNHNGNSSSVNHEPLRRMGSNSSSMSSGSANSAGHRLDSKTAEILSTSRKLTHRDLARLKKESKKSQRVKKSNKPQIAQVLEEMRKANNIDSNGNNNGINNNNNNNDDKAGYSRSGRHGRSNHDYHQRDNMSHGQSSQSHAHSSSDNDKSNQSKNSANLVASILTNVAGSDTSMTNSPMGGSGSSSSSLSGHPLGGSHPSGNDYAQSTNLYVGNLPLDISEPRLHQIFGKFGPIASVKIMWPRTEEEHARDRLCGFVSYMRRSDAEQALNALKDQYLFGERLRLGWGKPVTISKKAKMNNNTPNIANLPSIAAIPRPSSLTSLASSIVASNNNKNGNIGNIMNNNSHNNSNNNNNTSNNNNNNNNSKGNNVNGEAGKINVKENENSLKTQDNFATALLSNFEARLLGQKRIQVKIPTNEIIKNLIDHTAVMVSNYGEVFENEIIENERKEWENDQRKKKEILNSHENGRTLADLTLYDKWSFMFDQSMSNEYHCYYRWRVFSITMGDSLYQWRDVPFQIIVNGPHFIPPNVPDVPNYSLEYALSGKKIDDDKAGLNNDNNENDNDGNDNGNDNDNDININKERNESTIESIRSLHNNDRVRLPDKPLSEEDRRKFTKLLRTLTPQRYKIKEAMIFSLDHSDRATEVSEILSESLTLKETIYDKKIARLYLLSDILCNCHHGSVIVKNASAYRIEFRKYLRLIFSSLRDCWVNNIDSKQTSNEMKEKVLKVIGVWDKMYVFPAYFTKDLENIFLGKKTLNDNNKKRKNENDNNGKDTSSNNNGNNSNRKKSRNDTNGSNNSGINLNGINPTNENVSPASSLCKDAAGKDSGITMNKLEILKQKAMQAKQLFLSQNVNCHDNVAILPGRYDGDQMQDNECNSFNIELV